VKVNYKSIGVFSGRKKREYRVGDDGSVWRRSIYDDAEKMIALRDAGMLLKDIATQMKRPASTVSRTIRCHENRTWRQLSPALNTHGYRQLRFGRNEPHQQVHRLVLNAFVGECPKGMEACHNNGIRSDNRLSNLRWDTRSGNHADKRQHGTSNNGEKHSFAVLDNEAVRTIRESNDSLHALAVRYGVAKSTICRIQKRKRWSHIA